MLNTLNFLHSLVVDFVGGGVGLGGDVGDDGVGGDLVGLCVGVPLHSANIKETPAPPPLLASCSSTT